MPKCAKCGVTFPGKDVHMDITLRKGTYSVDRNPPFIHEWYVPVFSETLCVVCGTEMGESLQEWVRRLKNQTSSEKENVMYVDRRRIYHFEVLFGKSTSTSLVFNTYKSSISDKSKTMSTEEFHRFIKEVDVPMVDGEDIENFRFSSKKDAVKFLYTHLWRVTQDVTYPGIRIFRDDIEHLGPNLFRIGNNEIVLLMEKDILEV